MEIFTAIQPYFLPAAALVSAYLLCRVLAGVHMALFMVERPAEKTVDFAFDPTAVEMLPPLKTEHAKA